MPAGPTDTVRTAGFPRERQESTLVSDGLRGTATLIEGDRRETSVSRGSRVMRTR